MVGNFRELRTRIFDLLVLTALSAMVIFPALGQNRQWVSREIRHAEIVREMAENGDYLIPRAHGRGYTMTSHLVMHAIAAVLTRMAGVLEHDDYTPAVGCGRHTWGAGSLWYRIAAS